jgi:hypothetical protein
VPASGRLAASTNVMASGMGTARPAGSASSSAHVPMPRGAMKQTRLPMRSAATPSPTCLTIPAPSRPVVAGKVPGIGFRRPERIFPSTGLTLAACISMSTSPGPHLGDGLVDITRTSGPPYWVYSIALMVMHSPPIEAGLRETNPYPHRRAEQRTAASACRDAEVRRTRLRFGRFPRRLRDA